MSRLRKLLGPWIDTDRYRLTCDVETDVRRVEGLLAAGRVRDAAERYPGPLLPEQSRRPASCASASDSTRWLRQAVMTSDDVEAIWAWVQTPTGEDDLRRLEAPADRARVPRSAPRALRRARRRIAARRCNGHVTPQWCTACPAHHRGLSTARSALNLTWMLARAPEGVRADEVAARLGKSVSTAYNVLASLCDEHVAVRGPGGVYQIAPEFRTRSPASGAGEDLTGIVEDLLARTHKRAYAAVVRDGVLRIVLEQRPAGHAEAAGHGPRDPRQRARARARQGRARALAAGGRRPLHRPRPAAVHAEHDHQP